MAKCKKRGKTEVYPFWYMEDIVGMMNYFAENELWNWYLTFNIGLLLGRRVGDTLLLKWSDFYYENGRMKDEMEIKEQKTGKISRPYICGACKLAIKEYIEKTGINPMENYDEFVFPTERKTQLLKSKDEYSEDDFNEAMGEAVHSQGCVYRKHFKRAAKHIGIEYEVSTHSTRKSFGYWSVKLHPYDLTTVDKLQGIFEHSDRNTTLNYIGMSREGEIKLYEDMGDFISQIKNGEKPIIKNSPVVPLKSDDFRDLLSKCWEMAKSGKDKFDGINELIGMAEQLMV